MFWALQNYVQCTDELKMKKESPLINDIPVKIFKSIIEMHSILKYPVMLL